MEEIKQIENISNFEPWGGVTNPREHNPEKFRYLIHAINPMATVTMGLIGAVTLMDNPAPNADTGEGDQTVNLYSEPERLAERVALSCSLVDQDHTKTWGEAGLIVEALPGNVLVTSAKDVGAIASTKEVENLRREYSLLTAEQLLQQTGAGSYNEVVVVASKEGAKVKLAGFFYKVTSDGKPFDKSLYQQMKAHASRLNLPLIPIVEPNRYAKDGIIEKGEEYYVNFAGRQYCFKGPKIRSKFRAWHQEGFLTVASPEEMESVFAFMIKSGEDKDWIAQLRAEYTEWDQNRQQATVKHDRQTGQIYIEKISGYGTEAIETRIFTNGFARWNNLLDQARRLKEAMANPFLPELSRPFYDNLVSVEEAEKIVQEAIANLPDSEKEELIKWWATTKDKVAKRYEENARRMARAYPFYDTNSKKNISLSKTLPIASEVDYKIYLPDKKKGTF